MSVYFKKNCIRICALFICAFFLGCGQADSEYPRMVGDIQHDAQMDDPSFTTCKESEAKQYHNFGNGFQYDGEKKALEAEYYEQYVMDEQADQTGLIRIRFLVNCKGESGRFRVIGMNADYKPKVFTAEITDRLLEITRSLSGWPVRSIDGEAMDYYVYLIFKIEKGRLIEILP